MGRTAPIWRGADTVSLAPHKFYGLNGCGLLLKKKNLDPEKEAELQKEPKEKGDVPAMLLAAFLNLFLPAVIALLIFAGLIWLVFR